MKNKIILSLILIFMHINGVAKIKTLQEILGGGNAQDPLINMIAEPTEDITQSKASIQHEKELKEKRELQDYYISTMQEIKSQEPSSRNNNIDFPDKNVYLECTLVRAKKLYRWQDISISKAKSIHQYKTNMSFTTKKSCHHLDSVGKSCENYYKQTKDYIIYGVKEANRISMIYLNKHNTYVYILGIHDNSPWSKYANLIPETNYFNKPYETPLALQYKCKERAITVKERLKELKNMF